MVSMVKPIDSKGFSRARAAARFLLLCAILFLVPDGAVGGDAKPPARPKVAVFPLAGDAKSDLPKRVWDSFRKKLDRQDVYDVVDGPRMSELVEGLESPVVLQTPEDALRKLAADVDANLLIWGEVNAVAKGTALRLKILDLREPKPNVRQMEKIVEDPGQLRFAIESVLETLPGVGEFEHPNQDPVQHDAVAEALWKKNPNLVNNGDFTNAGGWDALYEAQKYSAPLSDELPALDKVNIYRLPGEKGGPPNNVLAMNLSQHAAEFNGMACLSAPIKIEPDTRYRISFRYKSDGPTLHVFVKGYTIAENIEGEKAEREIYRRQVPPTGATNGQWVTIVDELNPQQAHFPVQFLRVDHYAYYPPGRVMFDDVILKAVGKQTRHAKDDAIDQPVTRPSK